MGKGDKRTKRGKIWNNSYGKTRNRNNENTTERVTHGEEQPEQND